MVRSKFTEAELQRIEKAVQAAESQTRGEIVAVVVPQSQAYRWVGFFLSAMGAAVATAVAFLWAEVSGSLWGIRPDHLVVFQLGGALTGALLAGVKAIKRRIVPAAHLDAAVDKQALAEFVRHGVMNTGDRCGVLLLISLFEHRVEIVADRGIHSQVVPEFWQEETGRLASDLRAGRPLSDALCDAIGRLGALLATKFPRTADTVNELDDRLRG